MGKDKEDEMSNPAPTSSRSSKTILIEAIGWYGTMAIIGAYVLISFDVVDSKGVWYQLLNFSGAIGIVAVSWTKRAMQPAVLNAIWTLIAFVALLGITV